MHFGLKWSGTQFSAEDSPSVIHFSTPKLLPGEISIDDHNCENCGFHQKLISFIHGFPTDNSWSVSGYQCQKCGKFHEIKNDNKYKKPIKCDCGGILSRDNELFCPHCKNTDLKYLIKYLT